MVTITALWMPILVSAAVVFFVSFLMWMVLPHHRSDWAKVNDEDALRNVINDQKLGPGQYMVPYCINPKEMADPAMIAKFEEGPVGFFTLTPPTKPTMGGKILAGSAVYLVLSFFTGYLCSHTLEAGADTLSVFRIAGTISVLSYTGSLVPNAIWWGRSWSMAIKEIVDGIAYGLCTAGVFAWLWPAVAA